MSIPNRDRITPLSLKMYTRFHMPYNNSTTWNVQYPNAMKTVLFIYENIDTKFLGIQELYAYSRYDIPETF